MLIILKIHNDNIRINWSNLIFKIYKKYMYRKHPNAKGVFVFRKGSFGFLIMLIIFYGVILKNSAHIHCTLVMKFMFFVSYYDIINHLDLSDIFHEKNPKKIINPSSLYLKDWLFLMVFGLLVFCTVLFRSQELLTSDVSNFIIPLWGNMVIKIINITTGDSLISSNDISYMSKLPFCMHFIGLIGVHFFLEKNKNG